MGLSRNLLSGEFSRRSRNWLRTRVACSHYSALDLDVAEPLKAVDQKATQPSQGGRCETVHAVLTFAAACSAFDGSAFSQLFLLELCRPVRGIRCC